MCCKKKTNVQFSVCDIFNTINLRTCRSTSSREKAARVKRSNRHWLNDLRRSWMVCNWWRSIMPGVTTTLLSEVSPTKQWESGLTSPWKKLMARLRQRLRRWKTTRAFALSYFTMIVSTRCGMTIGRRRWCMVSPVMVHHNFRVYSRVAMLCTFANWVWV